MRFSGQFLTHLAVALVVLSTSATVVLAQAQADTNTTTTTGVSDVGPQAPGPQFQQVFAGDFTIASRRRATGPFGDRVHNAMSRGSLWDATGVVVADILPFSDDGLSSAAGPFFPTAVMPLVWRADGQYAAFSTLGVRGGDAHLSWEYARVETNSQTYAWMNGRFFLIGVNSTAAPLLTFTMYEETSTAR